ncbi:procathepsin L-like [Synchiropus splendidus]|uniref:procathepsin L-like n=1 Tax=Synchiropus splendidus TaxID=270530 RepID=UPI00237DBDFE|nr:procathepsin L-like [Synchiropus splendidus]
MKVLLLLFVAAVLAVANSKEVWDEFEEWKKAFGKTYEPHEESRYYQNFQRNHARVKAYLLSAKLGVTSFTAGLTIFADQDLDLWQNTSTCLIDVDLSVPQPGSSFIHWPSWLSVPASIDWRDRGYVTGVKSQTPQCGACWAFSAAGALEGQYFAKAGQLVSLSAQQLVDCSQAYGNNGCRGGLPTNAFNYVKAFGIESDTAYPYNAQDNPCKFDPGEVVAICTGIVPLPRGSEVDLMNAVGVVGPVSAGMDASHPSFQLYVAGVYDEPNCSSTRLTHDVLIVGYGNYRGQDYWLLKNSYGVKWGINGYMMLSRNKNNHCGIASLASYPQVKKKPSLHSSPTI